MSGMRDFTDLVVRDLLAVGFTGGVVAGIFFTETAAVSFLLGCLWLALNFSLLAWILKMFGGDQRPSGSFIFWLACAKIPASYFLLYWLYAVDYLDTAGLTAGLLVLPVVLVFRGLARSREEQIRGRG